MHRNGFAVAVVTFAAMALIGCEPKKEAPAPQVSASDIPKIVFGTDVSTTNPNVDLHAITRKNGSVVIWRDKVSPFYVVFDPAENPCNSNGGSSPYVYPSSTNSNGVNVVNCTISANPIGAGPYPYFIYGGLPPKEMKDIKVPTTSDHCEGCIIEVQDQ